MAYMNRTYVAFDGDKDMWAYAFMKGWDSREHIDFNFDDAHNIRELTNRAHDETYIKSVLRERMRSSNQFILLVGESTKYLRKYVQWEIELAIDLDIPIIVANLNGTNGIDEWLCPATLRKHLSIHGPFKKDFIKKAMNDFSAYYSYYRSTKSGPIFYNQQFN